MSKHDSYQLCHEKVKFLTKNYSLEKISYGKDLFLQILFPFLLLNRKFYYKVIVDKTQDSY